MIVDGRLIANDIKEQLKKKITGKQLSLVVFVMSQSLATQKFIEIKRKFANDIGIDVLVEELPDDISTKIVLGKVGEASAEHQGIIIQLPLSSHIDTDRVRNAVPASHDVDVIADASFAQFQQGVSSVLPPVAGAIAEIVLRYSVSVTGKNAVIVGAGRLVGKPAEVWFKNQGAEVIILDKHTANLKAETRKADILVLGAGIPGFIMPDMIKDGVVIFDAGTSEAEGKLAGDADPACASKAALFTPVPGGIGPITIAMIFKNLLTLTDSSV